MANIKISELTALTPPNAADLVPVTDASASQTKRTTVGEIVGIINGDVDVADDGAATISELPVSKLQDGAARQLLQTDAAGTGVEWTSSVSVSSAAVSDLTSGRVVLAGTSGELEDNAKLTFNGTQLDVDGNVVITGDLTVEGASTILETETVKVEDKNIELGVVASPTDVTADGGGITLKGDIDKTINWINSTDSWTSSENIDLASGKSYRINGTEVLSSTALGSAVTSSSLTSVGTLGSLTVTGSATAGSFNPTSSTTPANGFYLFGTNELALSTDSSDRIHINSAGTINIVGAGTAGVSQAVSFNGSAPVGSVVVDQSGRLLINTPSWSADDVFVVKANAVSGNNYALMALARGGLPGSSSSSLGFIRFTDNSGNIGAEITASADGAWTSGSNHLSRLVFRVTEDGNSSPASSPSAMTISSDQEVLIGYSTDNGAYKLQVNSQIFATSATIATSDGRYKENVATLDGCVDLVKALRPVSFDWKHQEPITRIDEEGETVVVREAHNFPDGTQVGFIAQEVETVLADKPWLGSVIKQNVRPAVTDNDGNELAPEEEFLGIAEGNLVAVLTSALKDAIGEIESLKARVAALEAS